MDFASWSRTQFDALKGQRLELANSWLEALDSVDLNAEVSENSLSRLLTHTQVICMLVKTQGYTGCNLVDLFYRVSLLVRQCCSFSRVELTKGKAF